MAKIYLRAREGEYVPVDELIDWVRFHPLPDGRIIPVLIWGMRGMGKTETIKAYCDDNDLEMVVVHPTQLAETAGVVGLPLIDSEGKTTSALPSWLPGPDSPPGILFLDEINRAPREVLNGLMQLIGEGRITQANYKLPDGWMIAAAANPSEMRSEGDEAYTVTILDEALVDRFLHYNPGYSAAGWAAWAKHQPINRKLIDFVLRNNELIEADELGGLPQEIETILGTSLRSATYCGYCLPEGEDIPERLVRVISYGLLGREGSQRLLEIWDEDEYAITFEDVISGGWEDRLMRWQGSKDKLDMLEASVSHIVAGLVVNPPDSDNPQSKEIAMAIGRFGSLLDQDYLEELYKQIERAAKTWLIPLQRTVHQFSKNRGDLF